MTDLRIQAEVSVEARRAEEGLRRAAAGVADVAGALESARTEATSAAAAIAAVAQAQASAAQAASSGGGSDIAAPLEEVAGAAAGAVEGLKAVDRSQDKAKLSAANLGAQIGDVASGLASGVPPAQIFAQQAAQIGFALSGMAGWLGRVGAFLSGPWGAALLGAIIILNSLRSGHKEADDAAQAQAKAEADLKKAIEELDRATDLSLKSQRESIRQGIEAAETAVAAARAKREEAKASLEAAIAERQATQIRATAPGPRGEVATLGLPVRDGVIDGLRGQLQELDKSIAATEGVLRGAVFRRSLSEIEAGSSAVAIATRAFEEAQIDLQRAVKDGTISQADAGRELAALKRVVDEAEAAERKGTSTRRTGTATLKENTRELREAERAAAAYARTIADIDREGRRGIGAGINELARANDAAARGDRPADRLTEIVTTIEGQFTAAGTSAGRAAGRSFARSAVELSNAIGSGIGGAFGKAVQASSGVASLLESARPGLGDRFNAGFNDAIKTAFGDVARRLESLFGRIFGDGGNFAQALGQIGGGISAGLAVAEIGNLFGLGLNPKNAARGAVAGAALGSIIPGVGTVIGAIVGSIFGGIIKPKNDFVDNRLTTTLDGVSSDVFNSRGGAKSINNGLTLADSVGSALTSVATQLGASVVSGVRLGAIGFSGDKFFFNPTGGDFKAAGNQRFDTPEEAVQAAVANALANGAIDASPRVKAALTRYGTNVNAAVAEALRVKELEDLLTSRDNPFLQAFRNLETQIRARNEVARANGFDLVEIERLNAEQREALLKDTLERTTGSVRSLLQELQFGSRATGSVAERLAGLTAERDRVAGLVRGGDTSQIDTVADLTRQIDDLQRQAFGSAGGFAAGRAESVSVLNDLVAQTEARIRAAADEAKAVNAASAARLQSMDATLEDSFNVQQRISDQLGAVLARLAIPFGDGSGFQLAQEYGR